VSAKDGAATPLEIFKQRNGPASEELLSLVKVNNKRKATIKKTLKEGPMTVPQLAEATGFEPADVLWTLTAMRKYGQAVEEGVDGDYPRYTLPEKELKR
jgi:predicted transcriptional regulator